MSVSQPTLFGEVGPRLPIADGHPAVFSDPVLAKFDELIEPGSLVLDPFAGTGKIHRLADVRTVGVEIQPAWAELHPRTICANARALPFADASFDMIATSPCYGNRMADHHENRDGSYRRSYFHDHRRLTGDPTARLHPDNAGLLKFTDSKYRTDHRAFWAEAVRVLRPGGGFLLNAKDYLSTQGPADGYRVWDEEHSKFRYRVTAWHVDVLVDLGLKVVGDHKVTTSGNRRGANRERIDAEDVIVLEKPTSGIRSPVSMAPRNPGGTGLAPGLKGTLPARDDGPYVNGYTPEVAARLANKVARARAAAPAYRARYDGAP